MNPNPAPGKSTSGPCLIEWIIVVIIVALIVVAFAGCANVTTTIVRRTPDGAISISSGKDVVIGYLEYEGGRLCPTGDCPRLVISNYSANANASVIRAQQERETALIKTAIESGAAALSAAKP